MKILFISHEATASGAPRLLMETQKWLRKNTALEFSTVFVRGGDLLPEFESIGRVIGVIETSSQRSVASRIVSKVRRIVSLLPDHLALKARRAGPFDLLYCNSIASASNISLFKECAPLVVSHIHELPALIGIFGPKAIEGLLSHSRHFFAVSNAVRTGLVEKFGVDPSRISLTSGFIGQDFGCDVDSKQAARQLRSHLNLPAEALVVGVCGIGGLTKGHDLLPQLVKNLPFSVAGREVHLVHVGRFANLSDLAMLKRDAEVLGVAARLHYVGPRTDVAEWIAGFDVLAHPSREDAFGLVLLEAAKFGVPAVCFAQGGGAPEFCETGAGAVVPYLRVDLMARTIENLLRDESSRAVMGQTAKDQLVVRYQADSAMPVWLDLVTKLVTQSRISG